VELSSHGDAEEDEDDEAGTANQAVQRGENQSAEMKWMDASRAVSFIAGSNLGSKASSRMDL
jgi:hypothetical protein